MRQRLRDVLQLCQAISQYTAGLDFADYGRDPKVRKPSIAQSTLARNSRIVFQSKLPLLQAHIAELIGKESKA